MTDKRRHSRTRVRGIQSALGQVTDLSQGGIGILKKGSLGVEIGEMLTLRITLDHHQATAQAQVVRVDPAGLFRHLIGLEFTSVSIADQATLRHMTEMARVAGNAPRCFRAA